MKNSRKRSLENSNMLPNYSFAIATCLQDDPNHLEEAFNTLINQTIRCNDISLVIDGKISAKSEALLKVLQDKCLSKEIDLGIHRHDISLGPGLARNTAISHTKTELIALMDADDLCNLNRMEETLKILKENKNIDIVCSVAIERHYDYENGWSDREEVKKCPPDHESISNLLRWSCPVCTPSVTLRRKTWTKAGGFPSLRRAGEDHLFFLKAIATSSKFYCIQLPLITVRLSHSHLSRRSGLRTLKDDIKFRIYAYNSGLIPATSMVCGMLISAIRRISPPVVSRLITIWGRNLSRAIHVWSTRF